MMIDEEHDEPEILEEEVESMTLREAYVDRLIGEPPRCPECSKMLLDRNTEKCGYCGFSFRYLEKMLPKADLPLLKRVTDFSNVLDDSSVAKIVRCQDVLQKRYPQFSQKVCILPLQESVKVQQMGLWMLNCCPQEDEEQLEEKYWIVLILVDTVAMKSSVTLGYKAEVFFDDDSLWKLINQLNGRMRKGGVEEAVVKIYNEMLEMLDSAKSQDRMQFKKFKKSRK